MADGTNISVAVERVIHDTLRDVIQKIADVHGIKVRDIRVEWESVEALGYPAKHFVTEVATHTVSVHQ